MRFDLPMFVKRHAYALAASGLILCGVALRLTLILIGWPHTNSEEGTMGLEAMHILLRSERPVYFYGQHYMGVGEAYFGALMFRLFGISITSLRLGMVAFYALFMAGVFWLAHLLYARRVALASLGVLIVGTPFVMQIELLADGGKAETLAFGAMMFALASWLALSRPSTKAPASKRLPRAVGFLAWGVCAGFGLYTYAVVAPFVLTSGLLLGIACWRELRGWTLALPLVGLLIGLLPVLYYTATNPFTDNPISVFLSLHSSLNTGDVSGWYLPLKQVDGTLLYTLPTVTGLVNLYPVGALPLYGPTDSATIAAVLIGGGWSLCYLALLAVATYRPWRTLRQGQQEGQRARRNAKTPDGEAPTNPPVQSATATAATAEAARDQPRHLARLLLALTGWLTIASYLFSATAANNPHSGRYMIGLLVIVPAILWPLLAKRLGSERAGSAPVSRAWRAILRNAWQPIGVALLGVSLILSVIATVQAMPEALAANQKDIRFVRELTGHGITRFYSDYWTCDLMNFVSREHLVCAVVGDYAQPGLTRYAPYDAAVRADPHAPYVLSHGSSIERTFLLHAAGSGQRYQVTYVFGRYYVYSPTPP